MKILPFGNFCLDFFFLPDLILLAISATEPVSAVATDAGVAVGYYASFVNSLSDI